MSMTKTFAALTADGFVLFTVQAANSAQARDFVRSVKTRSETIDKVRLLRSDDLARGTTVIPSRG